MWISKVSGTMIGGEAIPQGSLGDPMHYVIEFTCQNTKHKVVRAEWKEANWIYCELKEWNAAKELTMRKTEFYEEEEGHNFSVLPGKDGGPVVVLWDLKSDHPQCL
jgi:hypothetical protein